MAGLRISREKTCLDGRFPKQACPEGVLAVLRVTRAVAPSSVWNSAVFVDKNNLFRSARRISRELRGTLWKAIVFVDKNSLFGLEARISREIRGTAMEGQRFCR